MFVTNVADKLCWSGHVLAVFLHPGPHIYNSPPPSAADLKLLVGELDLLWRAEPEQDLAPETTWVFAPVPCITGKAETCRYGEEGGRVRQN